MVNQQAAAIIIAGALIAGAIALTNHWAPVGDGTMQLNRWTGTITSCFPIKISGGIEWQCPPKWPGRELTDEEVMKPQPPK